MHIVVCVYTLTSLSLLTAAKTPYFMLNDNQFENGSVIEIQSIGEEDSGLLAVTEFEDCCRDERIGECYYPDGSLVAIPSSGDALYRNRGDQLIRLNRRESENGDPPLGVYRCEVPDACGELTSIYIDLGMNSYT